MEEGRVEVDVEVVNVVVVNVVVEVVEVVDVVVVVVDVVGVVVVEGATLVATGMSVVSDDGDVNGADGWDSAFSKER